MSMGEAIGPEHPRRTRRRNLRYFFYVKHHKAGPSPDAQWSRHLTRDQEFDIFDEADFHGLRDDKGDLYGVRKGDDGVFDTIGTRGEQVAEFPVAPAGQAWHGYPCHPIARRKDGNRKVKPPLDALDRMEVVGILTDQQRRRLASGKTI